MNAASGNQVSGQISQEQYLQMMSVPHNWGKFRDKYSVSLAHSHLQYMLNEYNQQQMPEVALERRLCEALSHTYHYFLSDCHWLPVKWSDFKSDKMSSVKEFDQFLVKNIQAMVGDNPRAQAFYRARLIAMLASDTLRQQYIINYQDDLEPVDLAYIARHSQPDTAEIIIEQHWNSLSDADLLSIAESHPDLVANTIIKKGGFIERDPIKLLIPLCKKTQNLARLTLMPESTVCPSLSTGYKAMIATFYQDICQAFYEDISAKVISQNACLEDERIALQILMANSGCAERFLNHEELNKCFLPKEPEKIASILVELYSWHPDLLAQTFANFSWLMSQTLLQPYASQIVERRYPFISGISDIADHLNLYARTVLALTFPRYISGLLKEEEGKYLVNTPYLADYCNQFKAFSSYFIHQLYHYETTEEPGSDSLKSRLISPWARRHLREKSIRYLNLQNEPGFDDAKMLINQIPFKPKLINSHNIPLLTTYPFLLINYMKKEENREKALPANWIKGAFNRSIEGCRMVMTEPVYDDATKCMAASLFMQTLTELLKEPEKYLLDSSALAQEDTLLPLLLNPHQKYVARQQLESGKLDQFSGEGLFQLAMTHSPFAEALTRKADLFCRFTETQWQELKQKCPCFASASLEDDHDFASDDSELFMTPVGSLTDLTSLGEKTLTGCTTDEDVVSELKDLKIQEPSKPLKDGKTYLEEFFKLTQKPKDFSPPDFIPWTQHKLLGWRVRPGGICAGWCIYLNQRRWAYPSSNPMMVRYALSEKQAKGSDVSYDCNLPDKLDYLQRSSEHFLGKATEVSCSEGVPEIDLNKLYPLFPHFHQLMLSHGGHSIAVNVEFNAQGKCYFIVDDANKGSWCIKPSKWQSEDLRCLINDCLMCHGAGESITARPILPPEEPVKLNPVKYRTIQVSRTYALTEKYSHASPEKCQKPPFIG